MGVFVMRQPVLTLLTAASLLIVPVSLSLSASAQQVIDVQPAISSTNAPPDTSISGQFDTRGGEVDVRSVRIFVNDRDVTSRSTVTRNFFSYRPDQPFSPGPVRVRVDYRNINGEARTANWSFNVQPQSAVQINSVTHNASNGPLNTGSNLRVTINGTPGAQASVILVEDGQVVREFSARETSPGVYVLNLGVERSDRTNEGIVIGRLRRQNQTVFAAATQPVAINVPGNSGTPTPPNRPSPNPGSPNPGQEADLKPRFTSPNPNDRVGNQGFTLVGRTRPYAKVKVQVSASTSVLGVNLGGQSLVDREVTADSNGTFRVDVPAAPLPVPGLRYRVQATATDGNQTSAPTELNLRQ